MAAAGRRGAGLVGRHPAGGGAAGVPRPLGAARDGPRRGRRRPQRRVGARRRRRCSASRCAGWPGSRTGWCGSTRTGAGRATSRCSAASLAALPYVDDVRRRALAWRPSRQLTEVVGACVTCCPSCCGGGVPGSAVARRARSSATFRVAPRRPPGAAMVVGPDGEAVGSVSGGCVEGAVYELAQGWSATGSPVLQRYGRQRRRRVRGRADLRRLLDVFVEAVDAGDLPGARRGRRRRRRGPAGRGRDGDRPPGRRAGRRAARGAARWTPTPDAVPAPTGSLGSARADAAVTDDARGLLGPGRTETLTYGPDGERRGEGMRVFVASYAPPPRMLVFGAIDFAAAVARIGAFLGYRVTVCDARPRVRDRAAVPGRGRGRRRAGRTATWRRRPRPAGSTRARSSAC